MSKWKSSPNPDRPQGPEVSAEDRYAERQWDNYESGRPADLGHLFSLHFIGLANDRQTSFDYSEVPIASEGELVLDVPTDGKELPPGELGRRAMMMTADEAASLIADGL